MAYSDRGYTTGAPGRAIRAALRATREGSAFIPTGEPHAVTAGELGVPPDCEGTPVFLQRSARRGLAAFQVARASVHASTTSASAHLGGAAVPAYATPARRVWDDITPDDSDAARSEEASVVHRKRARLAYVYASGRLLDTSRFVSSMDLSARVFTRTLEHVNAGTTLPTFLRSNFDAIAATGIARVTIGMPKPATTAASVRVFKPCGCVDIADLLEAAKCLPMVHAYKYTLHDEVEGMYRVKYARAHTSVKRAKFIPVDAPCSCQPELDLQSELDQYRIQIQTSVLEKQSTVYPADIDDTMLGKPDLLRVPAELNMSLMTRDNDLLRAMVPQLEQFADGIIPGVTTPLLYIGARHTSFFLHSEDVNLASCNYLIAGAPKIWYCVPSEYYSKVVSLIATSAKRTGIFKTCQQAPMHKQLLITPEHLHAQGIPTSVVVQRAGDLIITAPGAFHFGFNTGLNLAEATNLASWQWWTRGAYHDYMSVGICKCKESPRLHFDHDELRTALLLVGARFGVKPSMIV